MKKYILSFCLIMFSLSLTSCINSKYSTPTKNIEYLCKSLVESNYNDMLNCFSNKDNFKIDMWKDIDNANLLNDVIYNYSVENATKTTYEIKEGANENQLIVDFTYVDGTKILNDALNLYLDDVITKLKNGVTVTTEDSLSLFSYYFSEVALQNDAEFVTTSVTFDFEQVNNSFLITNFDPAFYDVMYNNLITAYKDYNASLNTDTPEDPAQAESTETTTETETTEAPATN